MKEEVNNMGYKRINIINHKMTFRKKDSLLSQGMTTYLLKFCSFIGDFVADKTPLQKTKLVILSEAKKLINIEFSNVLSSYIK